MSWEKAAFLMFLTLAAAAAPTTAPSPSQSSSSSSSSSFSKSGRHRSSSDSPSTRASTRPTNSGGTAGSGGSEPRSNSSSSSRRMTYDDRYGTLEDHNIFLRDRTQQTSRTRGGSVSTSASTTRPAARPIEEFLVLTGLVEEDGGFHAYLENTETQIVTKVAVGDTLAHGRITAIELGAIAYEHNGQVTWVDVGSDLTGRPSIALSSTLLDGGTTPTTGPAGAAGAASTKPSGLEGVNPNDPNLTMEQRMKLRRLQGK